MLNLEPPNASAPDLNTPARRAVLQLTLFGPFVATIGTTTLHFKTRKARSVLAYVALGDTAGESRERLHGLLWSESDTAKAQVSLRAALKELKALFDACGFTGFNAGKQLLSFDRSLVELDVSDVIKATEAGVAHPELLQRTRLADSLLSDLESVDPQYSAWVRTRRHALHDRLTMMLEQALPAEIGDGGSVDLGQALQNLDSTNEIACRHIIRCRVARGEIGGALKAYKVLWDELDREFDTEPSPETQDLVVKLKQQSGWSTRPGEAVADELPVADVNLPPAEPQKLRKLFIVVDDFDVDGVPEQFRYVIKGFRVDLCATLSRFREWSVRPTRLTASTGSDLSDSGTQYILTATAFGGANQFRVVVTLLDDNANIVWARTYDLQAVELLASQDKIVRAIASALRVNLSADRLRRIGVQSELQTDLHDIWLRGQSLINTADPSASLLAERHMRTLIADAPEFSPGHSSLVQILNSRHIAFPGVFRRKESHREALEIALRAVHLDPQDSRARLAVAWAHQMAGRFPEAAMNADMAVDLNSYDAWTSMACAQIHAYCGNYRRGQDLLRQSISLSVMPSEAQNSYAAAIHFLAGEYSDAIQRGGAGLLASPAFLQWNAAALALDGRHEAATHVLRQTLRLARDRWVGDANPSDTLICKWLLHIFPIAIAADWKRLQQGLASAGGDVSDCQFGDW